ncbi:MAG: pyruvate kinase [Pseudomonadales bacterium]
MRNTKIVATLGPATTDYDTLKDLIAAGANVVRLNFSHGEPADHEDRVTKVRKASAELGVHVAILGDLQGPKIRIARFAEGSVVLEEGADFSLRTDMDKTAGDKNAVAVDYEALITDCDPGDRLLLDDGRVVLVVKEKLATELKCEVVVAGKLSNNKGINKEGGGLSAAALTEKDYADIELAASLDVDYLAVSFPRTGADLEDARQRMNAAGGNALIVAKIERAEVVATPEAMTDVISASDVVMVARGDLAVEIGDAALPGAQKKIIERSRKLGVPVITATQMMESMMDAPAPTRAEVLDVANAVLDGTDAVMLSGETAAGRYPVETVTAMAAVIEGTEAYEPQAVRDEALQQDSGQVDEAIANAAMYTARHMGTIKVVANMTESGHTASLMSRVTGALPIVAFCRRKRVANRLALLRNVTPVLISADEMVSDTRAEMVTHALNQRGWVQPGEQFILTYGSVNRPGGTNNMKIITV